MGYPRLLWLLALVAAALTPRCGAPKQAEDPRNILAEDLDSHGSQDESDAPPAGAVAPEGTGHTAKEDPPATRAECEAAARRMVELGLKAAHTGGSPTVSPAPAKPEENEKTVARAVQDCLAWNTPRSEALCVARANQEADIDRCAE